MIVCAVSDLHGRLPIIPECDIFLIAGDICPDFNLIEWKGHRFQRNDIKQLQYEWLENEYYYWEQQIVPAKRILCTFGNHDWNIKFPTNLRSKLYIDELVEVDGFNFYFTPWVNPCGNWNFQLPVERRIEMFSGIPAELDVLVAHSPAYGCLDRSYYNNEHAGCPILRKVIYYKQPKHMVHGHIHEGQRDGKQQLVDKTIVHNVAMFGKDWTPTLFELTAE